MADYGRELILDLHGCDPTTFKRSVIRKFMVECCKVMEVKRCDLHFWDDYSAIQFSLEGNVKVHTLASSSKDQVQMKAFLNIFSCKEFDPRKINVLAKETFKGKIVNRHIVRRI